MSKLRKSILIIGIIIIAVAASLGTALALFATGSLKTDPIELVYSIRPESKEYDGTPLKASEYRLDSGELVSGHVAEVTFIGEQTNVGASTSDLSVKIFDADGYNVTERYTIKVEKSSLAVTPKHLKVEMPSQKVVYNGDTVKFESYNVAEDSGDLVSGHVLAASSENAGLLNVGDTLPPDMKPLVFDKLGNDVTYNYEIDCEMGEIEIIPREISVRPVSKEKTYDGLEIVSDEIEYIEGSLVEGQWATYTINGGFDDRLIGAGSLVTYVKDFKVFAKVGGNDIEVTKNYTVDTFESGMLLVNPRAVTVAAKSGEWVYDGTAHSFLNDSDALSVEGLAPTDVVTRVHYIGSITNVGSADNLISDVEFNCSSDNYEITKVGGTLKVTPYELNVVTGSGEKYYDGAPLSNGALNLTLANLTHNFALADGQSYKEITNAGSIKNEYGIKITDDNGTDVTANYALSYEYGTLTVNKMPVTVTLSSAETVEYDGLEKFPTLSNPEYFSIVAVDEEHTETLALTYRDFSVALHTMEMVDAGAYSYSVNFREKSTYDNYVLEVTNYGYLTISPRRITVETATYERTYNGTPLYDTGIPQITSENKLVDTHTLVKPKVLPSITETGEIDNDYIVTISDSRGADKSGNYAITYKYGKLKISVCNLTISLKNYVGSDAFPYSAKEIQLDVEDAIVLLSPENIISKKDFTVVPSDKLENVGRYTYTVKITSESLAKNFNMSITAGNGTVEIAKREVVVYLRDVTRTYSGAEAEVDGTAAIHSIVDSSLVLSRDDFVVTYDMNRIPINCDDYTFKVRLTEENAKNYNLTLRNVLSGNAEATLKIEPFTVTVTTPSLEAVYDGLSHWAINFTHTALANVSHKIGLADVNDFPSVQDVDEGEVANDLDLKVTDLSGDDVTANYSIKEFNGKLKVTRRAVTITTGSDEKVYDGAPLTCGEIDCDNLADEQLAQIKDLEVLPQITHYGSIENRYSIEIVDGDGNDKTDNYDVTYVYGTLSVTKAKIKVETETQNDIEYDGMPHSNNGVNALAGLEGFESYTLAIAEGATAPEITDAGEIVNEFEVEIFDAASANVTADFEITYVYGKIAVLPRNIAVTYDGDYLNSFVYDGQIKQFHIESLIAEITNATVTGDDGGDVELLSKSDFALNMGSTPINAGDYEFTVSIRGNKAKNFEFTSLIGYARISPMPVYVNLNDLVKDFDDTAKTISVNEAIGGIEDEEGQAVDGNLVDITDFEVYSLSGEMRYVTDAGYDFFVKFTDSEKNKNFIIGGAKANLQILPLDINVTYSDLQYTFSGKEVTVGTENIKVDTRLLKNSDFTLTPNDSILNVGDYTYKASITDADYAKNFIFDTTAYGNVKVIPLKVTVTLKDYESIYDGENVEVVLSDAMTLSTSLLSVDDFELEDYLPVKDAGDYSYNAGLPDTFDGKDNFILNVVGGKVVIKALTVTVTLKNPTKIYDGTEYALDENLILSVDTALLEKTAFTVEYDAAGEHSDVGKYDYVVTLDGETNFKFSPAVGSVNVVKREVVAYTDNKSAVYSGAAVSSAAIINVTNIVAGHTYNADMTYFSKITDVGSVQNKLICIISDDKGRNVSANYDIKYVYGDLIVTPRPVTIKTGSEVFDYDGAAHKNETLESDVLDELGFTASIVTGVNYPEITNVGTVKNEYPVTIYALAENVTSNFAISYVYGTLKVNPCEVSVSLNGVERVYNGQIFNGADLNAVNTISTTLVRADDLEVYFDSTVKDAGTYVMNVRFKKASLNSNFDLTVANVAYLTVKKANLNVTLADVALTYNGNVQTVSVNNLAGMTIGTNYDALTYKNFKPVSDGQIKNADEYAYGVELVGERNLNNYELTFADGKVTVSGVDITLKVNKFNFVYSGKAALITADEAIAEISGNNAALAKKSDFAVKFAQSPVTPNVYTYSVEVADKACENNFNITVEGESSVTITKRKIDINIKDMLLSQAAFESAGGAGGLFDITNCIEISSYTQLLEGNKLVVRTAGAMGDGSGTKAEVYALELLITDLDGTTALGWFKVTDEGTTVDFGTMAKSECYEFNIQNLQDLTVNLTVI